MVGEVPAPKWLGTDAVLRVFADERATAVTAYRHFVAAGIGGASPWQGLKGQIYLGSDQFAERMQARIDPTRPLRQVPRRQRRAMAKPLADYAKRWADRDRAMAEAYRTGADSMQGIAEHFGVIRMTVSRAVKRREDVSAAQNVTCET
jgi:putative transposase